MTIIAIIYLDFYHTPMLQAMYFTTPMLLNFNGNTRLGRPRRNNSCNLQIGARSSWFEPAGWGRRGRADSGGAGKQGKRQRTPAAPAVAGVGEENLAIMAPLKNEQDGLGFEDT
jgi:hypothetical protein